MPRLVARLIPLVVSLGVLAFASLLFTGGVRGLDRTSRTFIGILLVTAVIVFLIRVL
jgi:hypothetical protein